MKIYSVAKNIKKIYIRLDKLPKGDYNNAIRVDKREQDGGENMVIKTNKLKGVIAQNEMTHKGIADLLKVAPNTFSRKINGTTPFTLVEAKIIADFFGMTIDELFFCDGVAKGKQSA